MVYRNQTGTDDDEKGDFYNHLGYKIINSCSFTRYFTQGTEILSDSKTLLLSSGLYSKSKLLMLKFNMDQCTFETIYEQKMDNKYFAEGITVANDD
mgnify:CR=1 FL=1